MPKNTPSVSHPSLVEVQSQFAAWRNTRQNQRERIPEALWSAAVKLCEHHSVNKISKALHLNYSDLRKRTSNTGPMQVAVSSSPQSFIAIDMEQPQPSECIIEMEHRNGNKMRMHFKGQAGLELQSFVDSFWS